MRTVLAAVIWAVLPASGLAQTTPPPATRSVAYAVHGMAATSDLRSTQAAVEILRAGGSAVDAAIAANAVQGVVEPMSCGIGGDLFAMGWSPGDGRPWGLNASGRAPSLATIDAMTARGHEQIPLFDPLAWSVPGCVAGWKDLHDRHGKLPWQDLFAPAIRLAEDGFPVSPVIAGYWKKAEGRLRATPEAAATYLLDGQAPSAGDVFRNPRLAATYRLIAAEGPAAFYEGDIAAKIDAYSRSQDGGLLRASDLAAHRNEWVDPVSTNYRGLDVWELPPNGQGIAALQILNILETFDVAAMGWGSAAYLHHFTEAKKLAFADRATFYADPAMADVPTDSLISKDYAARRAALIRPDQALTGVPAGDPKLVAGDTVYLCVVDADRNCCSLIQSNYYGFGSQRVPGDLGFALQNRGALFSLDPDHADVLAPGKRPFHTIIPAMTTRDGRPDMVFGVMGGDMQPQGHAQIVVHLVDFGMGLQQAGDAPRLRHNGSATPTGVPEETHETAEAVSADRWRAMLALHEQELSLAAARRRGETAAAIRDRESRVERLRTLLDESRTPTATEDAAELAEAKDEVLAEIEELEQELLEAMRNAPAGRDVNSEFKIVSLRKRLAVKKSLFEELVRRLAAVAAVPTAKPGVGTVLLEPGIPASTAAALSAKGHRVRTGGSFGGYQAIRIDWDRGVLEGASESRKDGAALGY